VSTLKSSAEHLTLNADGSGNDIKFQSNATEVAVIDQAGNLTLSGTVDGVDIQTLNTTAGAALPKAGGTMTGTIAGFTSTGIDDNATSTAITIDASENVGINNSSPTQRLEINGNAQFNMYDDPSGAGGYYTTKGMQIGNAFDAGLSGGDDDRNAIVWNERGTSLLFGTNNIERMRINADGNVGIGVVPEGHHNTHSALQVGGNGVWTSYKSQGASGEMDFQHNAYYSQAHGGDRYISTDEATKYRQVSGTHQWYTAGSGSAGSAPSWRYGMQINNDGYVTKPLQPAFHGYLNASITNNNGWTAVPLNSEKFDIGNNFSTSNGTFTVPVSGRYILTGHFHSQTSASYLYLAIYVGSTPLPYLDGRQSSNGTDTQLSGSVIVNLTANDAVTLSVYSNAGNFQIGGGDQRTSLAGYFLG
jgi:hypothetical protein